MLPMPKRMPYVIIPTSISLKAKGHTRAADTNLGCPRQTESMVTLRT